MRKKDFISPYSGERRNMLDKITMFVIGGITAVSIMYCLLYLSVEEGGRNEYQAYNYTVNP